MLGLLAAGVILGAVVTVLAIEWRNLHDWVKRCLVTLKTKIRGVIEGVRVFIQKLANGQAFQKSYNYSKNAAGQWEETIARKQIADNDVPPEIRERYRSAKVNNDIDITGSYSEVLKRTA